MDYIFTCRLNRKGAFTHAVGATSFCKVPQAAIEMTPEHKVTKADWVKTIMRETSRDDCGDIIVYVHGYNVDASEMLRAHRNIRNGLKKQGYKGTLISFDWPSDGNALAYAVDRIKAKLTALALVEDGIASFTRSIRPNCHVKMHILAHSMGCLVVREAFDLADDTAGIAAVNWSVSQVMFVAADISAKSLSDGSSRSGSLMLHTQRLTNYYSHFDEILSLSEVKRIGVAPRAGRVGIPAPENSKSVDVYCGAYFDKHKSRLGNALTRSHNWYFDDPAFLKDVVYVTEGRIDRNRIPTRAPTSEGGLALKP
jgi:esterase/lipase superfamily enzyme